MQNFKMPFRKSGELQFQNYNPFWTQKCSNFHLLNLRGEVPCRALSNTYIRETLKPRSKTIFFHKQIYVSRSQIQNFIEFGAKTGLKSSFKVGRFLVLPAGPSGAACLTTLQDGFKPVFAPNSMKFWI